MRRYTTTAILSPSFILPGKQNGFYNAEIPYLYIGQELRLEDYLNQIQLIHGQFDHTILYLGEHYSKILFSIPRQDFSEKISIYTCRCNYMSIYELVSNLRLSRAKVDTIDCDGEINYLFNIANNIINENR
ncbi:MAG: hypothetical protein RLZZ230_52 [Candidatus Parcubacteria bacterium]|jgi:hypothetical protein